MPLKKKLFRRKRRAPKRVFRKTYRKRGSGMTTAIKGNAFPKRVILNMPYADVISRTNVVGGFQDYQFRLNSLHDPDLTGTGHQPLGYDQWTGFYGRYRVFAVSYVIQFCSQNNATGNTFAICPTNSSTSFSSMSQAMETIQSRYRVTGAGENVCVFKGKYYLPKIGGDTRVSYMADDRFQAQIGNNPVEVMILHLLAADNTGATFAYTVDVKLVYHCELFDPHQIAQS